MAEEKAEAPAEEVEIVEADSGGGNKLVLILAAVNILLTLGVAAVVFMSFQKEKNSKVTDISAHSGEEKAGEHGAAAAGGHGAPASGGEHGGGGGGEHGGGAAQKKGVGPEFGKMIPLENFTVNLSSSGNVNPKFARVAISLEVPNGDTEGELTQKMPQVRNAIIDLFNAKRPSDLSTPEGRNFLKEEIQNAINTFLVTGKVKGVFFTSFALSS